MNPGGFMTALRFLTILPLGRGCELDGRGMARAMAWFPVAGALMGGALVGLDGLLPGRLPGPVVSVLLVALLALVTGGLHLDGFADTLDGMYGGRGDRERTLAIMKDSRIGAMGVIGLVLLLLLKYESVENLRGTLRVPGLLLMPVMARFSQVLMSYRAEYARREGSLAQPFVEHIGAGHVAFAATFTAGLSFWAAGVKGLVVLCAVVVLTYLAREYFHARIGGITGDTIGAVSEFNEVLVLLVMFLVE